MREHNIPLGPGAEFDAIRAMLDIWGDVASGIGDDAALLTVPEGQQFVVSTDATVEDVHFRRGWLTPRELGARATTAALSDLAAMGATARAILVSLVVPDAWRERLEELAAGIKDTVVSADAQIVGGNLAHGRTFSLTLTVIGHTSAPVRRSGASVGDVLCVTGILGGPQAAVAVFERGDEPSNWALDRFRSPRARLKEGMWLAEHGARAMIDISDGLSSDVQHLAAASHVTAIVEPNRIPRFDAVTPQEALQGGEEYELLVALPEVDAEHIAGLFTTHFALPLTRIGYLAASNSSPRVEIGGGHDHFSR